MMSFSKKNIRRSSIWAACIALLVLVCVPIRVSATDEMGMRLTGRILLQVEQNGEGWYINPVDYHRYNLGRPADALELMRKLGLGITNENLKKIPTADATWVGDPAVMAHVRGRILLQVEHHGEAWYVHPVTGKRYFLGRPTDAFRIMTAFGLGVSNQDLARIPIGVPGVTLPYRTLLNVPFSSQAPTGSWRAPFNEACEETVLIMLSHYYAKTGLDPMTVQEEILRMVDWEMKTYGHHQDTSANDTARTAREYANLPVTVSTDVSSYSIRKALSQGKPVIAPVFGQALNNPHYIGSGPYYHMILIVGYEGETFITHDPGTRYGNQYRIPSATLLNAIHDLTVPEWNAASGRKVMILVGS